MFRLSGKLLFGAAFLFALALLPAHAAKYPDRAKSTRTTVTVHVVWLPTIKSVNHLCSMMMGQPIPKDGMIVGCYNPANTTIYAAEPRSFNDTYRLEILGHEFWHALGAEHPAN